MASQYSIHKNTRKQPRSSLTREHPIDWGKQRLPPGSMDIPDTLHQIHAGRPGKYTDVIEMG